MMNDMSSFKACILLLSMISASFVFGDAVFPNDISKPQGQLQQVHSIHLSSNRQAEHRASDEVHNLRQQTTSRKHGIYRVVRRNGVSQDSNDAAYENSDMTDSSSSSTSNLRSHPRKKKLTAMVHIGPHKTATTSIQALTAIMHDELVADNYEMPWALVAKDLTRVNDEGSFVDLNVFNLVSCLQDVKELWPNAKCNPKLINATLEIASRNQNLILSSEEFARTNFVKVDRLQTLLKPWRHVRIVSYYRRFYEWLFSYWNQFAKYQEVQYRPSFPQYLSDMNEAKDLHNHTYTRGSVAKYAEYFHDIVVFNMHDQGEYTDVPELFFCEAVPDSPRACQTVKDRNAQGKHLRFNPVEGFVYQEMAWHAEQANLWDSTTSGKTLEMVTNMTRSRQETELRLTQYDFEGYLVCPSEETLNWLLQTTLDDEKYFFPDFFATAKGEAAIREKFELDRRTKLCGVDAKRLISESSQWRDFFRGIAATSAT